MTIKRRTSLVWLCLLLAYTPSTWATPSTRPSSTKKWSKESLNKAFFHFHQAAGHLESWAIMKQLKKPACQKGLEQAKAHLAKLPASVTKNSRHPFFTLSSYTRSAIRNAQANPKKPSVVQVEALRMRVHDMIRKFGLKHPKKWHEAFRRCRKAKPAKTATQAMRRTPPKPRK